MPQTPTDEGVATVEGMVKRIKNVAQTTNITMLSCNKQLTTSP